MTMATLYFVHISDTHFGPTTGYSLHGQASLPCAQRLVDIINNLPIKPDFVIHTGDVVTDPHPASYALASETFAGLRLPIYYVNGNHDTVQDIRDYLPMGPQEEVTADPSVLSYAFQLKGFRFLVLDARGPVETDPQGYLSESQMEVVRREAQPAGPPLVIFMHYPTLPLDSPWIDENLLVVNGDAFHQALLPARHRLRAVFYGHVHHSMQTIRDSIVYVAVGSSFSQFTAWPNDEHIDYNSQAPPAFNFVHLMSQQTIIHQHTFPRP
jgi:3',5'-cyclic AMP phosphodiesterase CpdA